jgi:hypothetical protein
LATVVALVPLIGAVALGAEAGSWYVIKQHAQNAADAAAYGGGLQLACSSAASSQTVPCSDTTPATTTVGAVAYRGNEIAAQNGFCNAGDNTSYPGRQCAAPLVNTSQSVSVDTGTWNNSTQSWTTTSSGEFVRVTIGQQQPAYLASVLGFSTINIGAQAIAQVQVSQAAPPCILALQGPIALSGSASVSSKTCGIASNSTAQNAISFTGTASSANVASTVTTGNCQNNGSANQCYNVTPYAAAIPDPLSALNSVMSSLTTSSFSAGTCPSSTVTPYETTPCYNAGNQTLSGPLNGTYYFNGTVNIGSVSGTATLVLFGSGASLSKMTGNPTVTLTAEKDPAVPSALSAVSSLMTDLLIYDPESYSSKGVQLTGDSNSTFNGVIYVPNTPVTFQGNNKTQTNVCTEVIAYAVTFSGNPNFDDSSCKTDGAAVPIVQSVSLVQ